MSEMTWQELVEKAKELGYELREDDYFDALESYGKYKYLEKRSGVVIFLDIGIVETPYQAIATNRTPDQMYQIMLALED